MISIRALRIFAVVLAMTTAAHGGKPGESLGRTYTTIERMAPERLEAAQRDVRRHQSERRVIAPMAGLQDYRAILHAHASDSAHTGGTSEEILADAKTEGVDVIMLSDHFRPPKDFMDSWRGLRDGVLFIPGSEGHGFLLYPEVSVFDEMSGPKEELIAATGAGSGMLFLSHVEERMDHSMVGLTGMEIYNRHHDANDDMDLLFKLVQWVTDPDEAKRVAKLVEQYPDEILATQLDYPADYLSKWDRESQEQKVVGVAANDCHHNQVIIVKMVDETSVLIGTVVDDDDEMRTFTAEQRPRIPEMTEGHQPGDVLVSLDLDPYAASFRNVSTHVLASELTEDAIRAALGAGHAYVSHDWMCDPTGFRFRAGDAIMGDDAKLASGVELIAEFPVDCQIRLIRNGEENWNGSGNEMRRAVTEAGVYRVEGWLTVDGEDRVWIYSNPIYVR